MASTHIPFELLTPIHPNRRLTLESGPTPIAPRLIDLLVPLGFGQRALVVSPPQTGKTTILRQSAAAVLQNFPDVRLFLCLVDERPEEVTDWRTQVKGSHVRLYASSFDQKASRHGYVVEQALHDARREVEQGHDVVMLLDSLTRLARAHNLNPEMWQTSRQQRGSYGSRTLSGGIDAQALEIGRRVFGAARALEEGGSLTIIASCLVETGSRLDEVVYEEFKGTGNLEIRLSREMAERRIFPAMNIAQSGTRKEEKLLPAPVLAKVHTLRRALAGTDPMNAMKMLLERLQKFPSNDAFLKSF